MYAQWRSQPDMWSCKCKFFCVYRPYKESVSKEMNNDDLNLHLHDQIVGGLYSGENYVCGVKLSVCVHTE